MERRCLRGGRCPPPITEVRCKAQGEQVYLKSLEDREKQLCATRYSMPTSRTGNCPLSSLQLSQICMDAEERYATGIQPSSNQGVVKADDT